MNQQAPHLFRPLVLRGLELKNRIVISPMCQNAADAQGAMGDYHLVHLGQFALGGAGLVFAESTAVTPEARINEFDVGLWSDRQIAPLARAADFVRAQGAAFGVQLAHAGRKAGAAVLCDGGAPFPADALRRDCGVIFERMGPSALAAGEGWSVPRAMTEEDLARARRQFVEAALRADEAGVDVIELHYAHGYLVASFLSPLANLREDGYGGDFTGRCRLAKEIASDVRAVWPAAKPLFCRLSAVDGEEGGWSLEDSVRLARELKAIGVDVIDCSSGGLRDATKTASAPREPGFQTSYAKRIREDAQLPTQAVGMILTAAQAEEILATGAADLVAIGREALYDPFWAHHAEQTLGYDVEFVSWRRYNAAYLAKRRPIMVQLGLAPAASSAGEG